MELGLHWVGMGVKASLSLSLAPVGCHDEWTMMMTLMKDDG